MRVFLTGANGYLGSVLVDQFSRMAGVECVTGVALNTPNRPLPDKVRFFSLDIRSPDILKVMAGHDVVVHAACVVLWSAAMPAAERDAINLAGVRNVAKAALANNVRHFVQASSMAAYDPFLARGKTEVDEDFPLGAGNSPFYYWNAKALGERILSEVFSGKDILFSLLRPIYIMGPRNRLVVKRYRDNAINFIGCDPRRQFIHEQDVASAFRHVISAGLPGPFNVVPDDFLSLTDVWKTVGARFVPTVPLCLAQLVTWIRWRYFKSPIHSSWVTDMLIDFTGSNARLRKTGWSPQYTSAGALAAAL
jgi:nucleoside-diphosphate-sugar epimerase